MKPFNDKFKKIKAWRNNLCKTHRVHISYRSRQHYQHIHVRGPVFQGFICCHIEMLSTKNLRELNI